MMAGKLLQCFTWRRVKWLLLWSVIIFAIGSYLANWWSVRLEKIVVDGRPKYTLKARIHLGLAGLPPGTSSNTFNALGKIGTHQGSQSKLNRTENHGGGKLVTAALNHSKLKPAISNNVDVRRTTIRTPVIRKTTPKRDNPLSRTNHYSPSSVKVEDIPVINVRGASCEALFSNDRMEMKKASEYQAMNPKIIVPDRKIQQQAQNCEQFRQERKYIMSPVNQEEADFPIAFSLLLFKDVEMVERLLRAVYRPQNYYCIHVDVKSNPDVRNAMRAIADCFDNVFMSSRSVDVQWAWYSVLEPEIICMEDLWKKYAPKWKYFINLTGQEFPLKTNWELVKILKAYNGANDMESTIARRNEYRTQYVHKGFYPTDEKKEPCPVDATISKGSVHIAVQSGFVDFVLHNPTGQKFLQWVKNTGVPDETFFSSLNVSPQLGVPGATTGDKETNKDTNPFMTRFKNWGTWPFDFPCAGQRVRMVCIFSIGDLPLLASRPEMFANKFYPTYNPIAYDCMEQLHYNKTRNQVLGDAVFHDEYYRSLDFVKHHIS